MGRSRACIVAGHAMQCEKQHLGRVAQRVTTGRFLPIKEEFARSTKRQMGARQTANSFSSSFMISANGTRAILAFCLPTPVVAAREPPRGLHAFKNADNTAVVSRSVSPAPHSTADTTILISVSHPRSLPPFRHTPRLEFTANRPLSPSLHPLHFPPSPPSPNIHM